MSTQIIEFNGYQFGGQNYNLHHWLSNGDGSSEYFSNSYDGTSETVIVKLMHNAYGGGYHGQNTTWSAIWSEIHSNINTLIIDLNGHTWNPTEVTTIIDVTDLTRQLEIIIENGTIESDIRLVNDENPNGDQVTNSSVTFRNVTLKNTGNINLSAAHARLNYLAFYQCLWINPMSIDIDGNKSYYKSNKIIIEDCSIVGLTSYFIDVRGEAWVFNSASSVRYINNTVDLSNIVDMKRTYIENTNQPILVNGKTNGSGSNFEGLYISNGAGGELSSKVAAKNDSVFYSVDVNDDLYLVPRPDSILSGETVTQDCDSRISSYNTIGLNGIFENAPNRSVGCMSAPIIIDKPENVIVSQTSDSIAFEWVNPSNATRASKMEFFTTDNQDDSDFSNKVSECESTETSHSILYSLLPNNGNCFIKLRYAI